MQVAATLRYARISPQKCRLVADVIRGKSVDDALRALTFSPKKSARIVKKILESAVANAEHNHGADIDELKVATIEVNEAPTFKRFRARAKGRGARNPRWRREVTWARKYIQQEYASASSRNGHRSGMPIPKCSPCTSAGITRCESSSRRS